MAIFGRASLSAKAVRGVIVFTVVEVVTLVSWLALALKPQYQVQAVVVLAGGLLLEHYIATQVGQQDK